MCRRTNRLLSEETGGAKGNVWPDARDGVQLSQGPAFDGGVQRLVLAFVVKVSDKEGRTPGFNGLPPF